MHVLQFASPTGKRGRGIRNVITSPSTPVKKDLSDLADLVGHHNSRIRLYTACVDGSSLTLIRLQLTTQDDTRLSQTQRFGLTGQSLTIGVLSHSSSHSRRVSLELAASRAHAWRHASFHPLRKFLLPDHRWRFHKISFARNTSLVVVVFMKEDPAWTGTWTYLSSSS